MFVSDLKCLSTSRDNAAGFWNRENFKNITHWIFGLWSGTPWIIHRVMIRHCLRPVDILDILRPSFLQLMIDCFPSIWLCSVPHNVVAGWKLGVFRMGRLLKKHHWICDHDHSWQGGGSKGGDHTLLGFFNTPKLVVWLY